MIRRYPAVATGAAALVVSAVIVVLANTRPGFDPYGWLVWGHQTINLSLDTNAAPSWKPLPYLFTVPFALFGHYQVWLWMIASVAVSLSAVVFAARIAYRLTLREVTPEPGLERPEPAVATPEPGLARPEPAVATPAPGLERPPEPAVATPEPGLARPEPGLARPERRYAGIVAGAFAAVAVLGMRDYSHYVLSAQSDPMIVALCLGAIDAHLSRRPRWAFALGVLAGLGRPEVWLFLGLYSIWAWRTIPSMRWLIVAGVGTMLVLWFGIPGLTSRSPFVAGTNAQGSGRALHSDKVFGTIDRFLDLHETTVYVVALAALALAVFRRDRVILVLAAGTLAWVVLEIAFALHGWPGLPRYMYEAAAVMVVLAAVGVGRLLVEAPRISHPAGWGGVALAVVIAGSLVPAAISRGRIEHKDLNVQQARTDQINRLATVIRRYGGAARFKPCGEPLTRLEYQTVLAWQLRVNVATVGFRYSKAVQSGRPIVLFTPGRRGWRIKAVHQRLHSCRRLPR